MVDPTMVGTLYTTLSMMDTLGSLLAGPSIAAAFKWGMRLGGVWLGLPYMLSMGLCGPVSILMFVVKLPAEDYHQE